MLKLPERGYRKYRFAMISGLGYLIAATFLGFIGLTADADPTALGIMFGGLSTGVIGVAGAFIWGNTQENGKKDA
jgi:hypothetical protein